MTERTPLGSTIVPTTLLKVAPTITRPSTNPAHLPSSAMLPPVHASAAYQDRVGVRGGGWGGRPPPGDRIPSLGGRRVGRRRPRDCAGALAWAGMEAQSSPATSRPMLLTVDDDPSVSRAVARDLRRRYGHDHQVVRAGSGAEALDALREIKLRGGRVAVMLADYRMPEMNGIEFLEAAMDLFPRARRALLTAYADTDAAIAAINLVDVDHYLLKPWEPPEEKLYPVIDAMIDAFSATGDGEMRE